MLKNEKFITILTIVIIFAFTAVSNNNFTF